MDFRTEVISALDRVIASGVIEKAIETSITKTVVEIIQGQLRTYSELGKQIEKSVAQSLALNGSLDLPSYNDTLLKIIRKQVQQLTEDTIQRQVAKNMEELLTPPPESIKLSELVDAYKELSDKLESGVGYGNQITLRLCRDQGTLNDFVYIELDDKPRTERFSCAIRIGVHKGEAFSLHFKNKDVDRDMFAGPFYNFERMLFQMKAAKSKIVFDVDEHEIDTSYSREDY